MVPPPGALVRGVYRIGGRWPRVAEPLTLPRVLCMMPGVARLNDVLCDRPRILFVGINPSLTSARVGHHFAGRGNPFWRLLHAAGLVAEAIGHTDDRRLAEWRLGLTNLCPRPTRSASGLTTAEVRRGCQALRRKVEALRPAVVAFVGLSIYRTCFGPRAIPGAGEKPHDFAGARVFVLPNPSGLNASFPGFRDKLVWYERLRRFSEQLPRRPARRRARRTARR